MIKLQLRRKSLPSRVIEVTQFPCSIGRASENQISVEELSVSSKHAVILERPGGFVVEDLGSTNGLVLRGAKTKKIPLSAGVCFTIGTIEIKIIEVSKAAGRPTVLQRKFDQSQPLTHLRSSLLTRINKSIDVLIGSASWTHVLIAYSFISASVIWEARGVAVWDGLDSLLALAAISLMYGLISLVLAAIALLFSEKQTFIQQFKRTLLLTFSYHVAWLTSTGIRPVLFLNLDNLALSSFIFWASATLGLGFFGFVWCRIGLLQEKRPTLGKALSAIVGLGVLCVLFYCYVYRDREVYQSEVAVSYRHFTQNNRPLSRLNSMLDETFIKLEEGRRRGR